MRIRDDDVPLARFAVAAWTNPDFIGLMVMRTMLGAWIQSAGVHESSAKMMSSISSLPLSFLRTGFNVITEFLMKDLPPVTLPAPPSLDPVSENEDINPEQKFVFGNIPPCLVGE